MSGGGERVLVVGVSTRALVESAVRAGYACASIDAFGDLDQRAPARSVARELGRPYSAAAVLALARGCPADAVAYVANLENHPAAVRRLAAGRRLLGNDAAALRGARDPERLARVVHQAGGSFPETLSPALAGGADPRREWLRKPARGGGGSGIAHWRPGERLSAREVLQERVEGVPASAAFVADGRRAVLLGLSRQWSGEAAFGARGYRYCGSLFPLEAGPSLRRRLEALAGAVTAAFGLRGANGIDFVLRDGEPWVLEVNPRPTASMELIERSTGLSVFAAHARACQGEMCDAPTAPDAVHGKAILFARRDVVLGDTRAWLERDDIRDIPHPGERIARGHPICTLFASAPDPERCAAGLAGAAAALQGEIYGPTPVHP